MRRENGARLDLAGGSHGETETARHQRRHLFLALETALRQRLHLLQQRVVDIVQLSRQSLRLRAEQIGRLRRPHAREGVADGLLDGLHGRLLLESRRERDADALLAGATGAAAAVNVRLDVGAAGVGAGRLAVDHQRDLCGRERERRYALDVQAARGDVGGDETAELALFEVLQRLLARLLRDVAVENARLR